MICPFTYVNVCCASPLRQDDIPSPGDIGPRGILLLICDGDPISAAFLLARMLCSFTRCECFGSLGSKSECQLTPSVYMLVMLEPAQRPTWLPPYHMSVLYDHPCIDEIVHKGSATQSYSSCDAQRQQQTTAQQRHHSVAHTKHSQLSHNTLAITLAMSSGVRSSRVVYAQDQIWHPPSFSVHASGWPVVDT